MASKRKVPITIITGYLGSGKTTLLRRIIDDPAGNGRRIAIIMNEFGRIPIDGKTIEGRDIRIAELSGGCVCCSLSGEFSAAVNELISAKRPGWILVETTGIAEPSALAYDIENNIKGVKLDSVITIVDADAVSRFPSIGHTGQEQIGIADLLIVNKCDLISPQEQTSVRSRLRKMNGRATVIGTSECIFDLGLVFGNHFARNVRKEAPIHAETDHSPDFESIEFSSVLDFDYEKILAFIKGLPKDIFRIKGFIRTERGPFLVDRVAGRMRLEEFKNDKTELVFIGKGIEEWCGKIRKGLDQCAL